MLLIRNSLPPDLKAVIFDWGDTLMHDFREKPGPMYLWDRIEVVQGIPEFLEKISEKYKLFVGSNSGESNTEMMVKALERGGIAKYFNGFFASTDMAYAKPDPRFFTTILQSIGYESNAVAMCGNDLVKDINAAKSAGLFTLFYKIAETNNDISGADIIFDNFKELDGLF
ncbi:MAG: HAD family hydrolase [Bacteroidales bacterium]|nr:HAD family hydrolase [Bacteroidales bacterium]